MSNLLLHRKRKENKQFKRVKHMDISFILDQRGRDGCSSGFWSCSHGFGVKCEHLSDLLKRVLYNRKLKKGSVTLFTVFVQKFAEKKNSQISVQVASGDHIVFISQTDNI